MSTADLPQGSRDLSILWGVRPDRNHGLGVSRRIEQITGGTFTVETGSLFPALHCFEQSGWVRGSRGDPANNRRAKYDQLSTAGRSQLQETTEQRQRVALAIHRALKATFRRGPRGRARACPRPTSSAIGRAPDTDSRARPAPPRAGRAPCPRRTRGTCSTGPIGLPRADGRARRLAYHAPWRPTGVRAESESAVRRGGCSCSPGTSPAW